MLPMENKDYEITKQVCTALPFQLNQAGRGSASPIE
jgi:hypothetical protein